MEDAYQWVPSVLCAFCVLVVLVALAFLSRSLPVRLSSRQRELEDEMEAVRRDASGIRTSWTQFLTDFEELAESIEDRLERTESRRKAANSDRRRAEAARDQVAEEQQQGGGEETLEQFEARKRAELGLRH